MKRISSFTISVFILLCVFLTANSAGATKVEIRGQIANETAGIRNYLDLSSGFVSWGPQNFAGFYYDATDELGNENLTLIPTLTSGVPGRTIAENNLIYSTRGDAKQLKVVEERFNGDAAAATAAGLEGFGAGDMSAVAGSYKIVGWQAKKYVALKNKTNRLANLVIEHGQAERKTLAAGESWDVGGGWTLTAQSIDARAWPPALLTLNKDGIKKDEKVISDAKIYTYVEKSLGDEIGVPVFVTLVTFPAEEPAEIMQLRYTWAIDTSVTEIKADDQYGVFKVREADVDQIRMSTDSLLILPQDSIVDLIGGMNFRVVDSPTLRFYPVVEYETKTDSPTLSPTSAITADPSAALPKEIMSESKETPGFEVIIAIVALGAVSIFKKKRI
ncbi:MAG: hypothetical protein FIB08_09705 [Candidatus Methanoperedens sp.]|nr:hypothetical protein [Candidatus Methanoperedens sp.]